MLSQKLLQAIRSISGDAPNNTVCIRDNADNVYCYSTDTWLETHSFTGLSCGVSDYLPYSGLFFPPDYSFFITNGVNGFGAYSFPSGTELLLVSNTAAGTPAVSKDGSKIACSIGGLDIGIYETTSWTQIATITDINSIEYVLDWSHDGSKLAIASGNGRVRIYETTTWTLWSNTLDAGSNTVWDVSFSPDDSMLAVGFDSSDYTDVFQVITVATTMTFGSEFRSNLLNRDARGVEWSPDGSILYVTQVYHLTSTYEAVRAFNTTTWAPITMPSYPCIYANSVRSNKEHTMLATGGTPYIFRNVSDYSEIPGTSAVVDGRGEAFITV